MEGINFQFLSTVDWDEIIRKAFQQVLKSGAVSSRPSLVCHDVIWYDLAKQAILMVIFSP